MGKYFISSDIEGVTDICHWDEATKQNPDYSQFQNIMINEVVAICESFKKTDKITVRDAHASARNLVHERLPLNTELIRGFNGNPCCMMFGIDKSYDFSILHGYHAAAGNGINPLAHTLSSKNIFETKLNGRVIGETTISILTSNYFGVPMCYIAGDKGAVEEAQALNPNIIGTVTKYGEGSSTVSAHPLTIQNAIKKDLKQVIELFSKNKTACKVKLPKEFDFEITYKEHIKAYRCSFYPGAKLIRDNCVAFHTKDFMELQRMLMFCT